MYRGLPGSLGFNFQDAFELLALCCRSAFLLEYCKQPEKMQKQTMQMPGPGTVKHYDLCMEWETYLHYPMIYVWNGNFIFSILYKYGILILMIYIPNAPLCWNTYLQNWVT